MKIVLHSDGIMCQGYLPENHIDNNTLELRGGKDKILSALKYIAFVNNDVLYFKSERDYLNLKECKAGLEVAMDYQSAIEYIEATDTFVSDIEGGEWINYGGSEIIVPKQIYHLPMHVLELSLSNLLVWRAMKNTTIRNLDNKLNDDKSDVVIKFFKYLKNIKEAIGTGSFTKTFEASMSLKLYLTSQSHLLNLLSGDSDLGLILNAICLKITSQCFDYLESVENQHKQLFEIKFKELE